MSTEWSEGHGDCPFCGSRDLYARSRGSRVSCRVCGAKGPEAANETLAWGAWDRRLSRLQRLRQLVEKAERDLDLRKAVLDEHLREKSDGGKE